MRVDVDAGRYEYEDPVYRALEKESGDFWEPRFRMKISERSLFWPRSSYNFKKFLLNLNRDLDKIKRDVEFNRDFPFYYNHSIYSFSATLLPIELMVLLLEDRRFFVHRGVELRSIIRGFRRLVVRGKFGGISTIDQQVVRISTRRYERSVGRKFKELALAYIINFHCPKREIFDYYLHNAYLGYRIEGCEVAAQKLFGLGAAELNWKQAAFVASLFPLPFPSVAWHQYVKSIHYPVADPDEILQIVQNIAPKWSKRVKYRMELALKNQDFKPKSL